MLSFDDIINLKIVNDFAYACHRLTGLWISIGDSEFMKLKLFYDLEYMNKYCKLIRSTVQGLNLCLQSDKEGCKQAFAKNLPHIHQCKAGLIDIFAPITVYDKMVGYISAGQILTEKPTEKSFSKISSFYKGLNINMSERKKAYLDTPVISEAKLNELVTLFTLLINYIAEMETKMLFLNKTKDNDVICKTKGYILHNYMEPIHLNEIAKFVAISPEYLCRLFKKATGNTITEYINILRMENAKKILKSSDVKISGVAMETGFKSVSYFNRMFKKILGISPREFRKTSQ